MDVNSDNIDMPDDIESETARWIAEKQEEELLEKNKKQENDKFDALNKWNIVNSKRHSNKQGRREPYSSNGQQQYGENNYPHGRFSEGIRPARSLAKGKAIAANKYSPKPRFINQERLNLGNNGPPLNKTAYSGQRTGEAPNVPYRKFTPSLQRHTVNGVRIHAFNLPTIFIEDRKTNEKVISDEESKQASNELNQARAPTAMEGVIATPVHKNKSI